MVYLPLTLVRYHNCEQSLFCCGIPVVLGEVRLAVRLTPTPMFCRQYQPFSTFSATPRVLVILARTCSVVMLVTGMSSQSEPSSGVAFRLACQPAIQWSNFSFRLVLSLASLKLGFSYFSALLLHVIVTQFVLALSFALPPLQKICRGSILPDTFSGLLVRQFRLSALLTQQCPGIIGLTIQIWL